MGAGGPSAVGAESVYRNSESRDYYEYRTTKHLFIGSHESLSTSKGVLGSD